MPYIRNEKEEVSGTYPSPQSGQPQSHTYQMWHCWPQTGRQALAHGPWARSASKLSWPLMRSASLLCVRSTIDEHCFQAHQLMVDLVPARTQGAIALFFPFCSYCGALWMCRNTQRSGSPLDWLFSSFILSLPTTHQRWPRSGSQWLVVGRTRQRKVNPWTRWLYPSKDTRPVPVSSLISLSSMSRNWAWKCLWMVSQHTSLSISFYIMDWPVRSTHEVHLLMGQSI